MLRTTLTALSGIPQCLWISRWLFSVHHVECLPGVHEVEIEWRLPLPGQLGDDTECCSLVCTRPPSPTSCLFLSRPAVRSGPGPLQHQPRDLAGQRQELNSSPVLAVAEISSSGEFDRVALSPLVRHLFPVPYLLSVSPGVRCNCSVRLHGFQRGLVSGPGASPLLVVLMACTSSSFGDGPEI